jgi:autotransporter-associated beta strand protein
MKLIFAFFLIFATSFIDSFFAQTLTISNSGQTGTTGTNWYVSGSNPVRIIGTQTASVNTSVIQGYINAGLDVLIFSVGEIAIQNDLTKTNSGRLILRPGNNTISGAGKIILGNNAQLLLSNGATISNNIELNSGSSTISFAQVEIEYLIVGGGASGGVGRGGGGGAGGVLTGSLDATSTSYTITVGAGGSAVTYDQRGINGGNSTAFGLTAFGGGAGGGWVAGTESGLSGGSGGGGSGSPYVAGSGTFGQGNNGFWLNFYREEGGGGGGAGSAASYQNGGSGISSSISGTQLWYGGGGGAGALSYGAQPAGIGGNGGGGNGNKIVNGTAGSGAANTGGGGGGTEGHYGWSGAGGSGVVIVRYLGADVSSGGIEYVGTGAAVGYIVHQFNSGTSALTINQGTFSGTLSGLISGTGNLVLNPLNGTLSLTANNTFSGTTTISSGNIQVGNNSTTGTLGTGNIINNSTITFLRSNTISIPGVISGSGALVQQGTGNLILTQNNTCTGNTTISAGTIQLGNGATTGTVGSGSITNNGTLSINRSDVYFFNNTMSGTGSMTKEGSGRVNILAANSYTGGTTLSSGTLAIYHASALGSGTVTLAANSTLLSGRSVSTFSNPIVLTGNATIALDNELEFLLVGGGGGGASGGGGGGGVVHQTATVSSGNTYTVTVGAGGSGGDPNGSSGANGASTVFNGFTAFGGGGGAKVQIAGLSGASGGGAGADSNLAGGTATQGFPGGAGVSNTAGSSASGGGGAAAAGSTGWTISSYNTFYNIASGQNTMGGNGGSGLANSINGITTFYGGGGGGGCNNNNGTQPTSRAGQGGQGGGGIGAHGDGISGTAGTANTGGGGGGGDWEATTGGSGGSGIAIIRYVGTTTGTGGAIASGAGTAAGYTIHTFTAVGNNTFTLNTSALNLTGVMSGTGHITFNATNGSITLSAANTYTGNTTITSGSLIVNTTGSLNGGTYAGTISNGGTLSFRSSANQVLSGIISGNGALIKETSTSVLTLTANNTYTGTTTISSGTLAIGNNTTTGTFGTGAVINNSAISINRSDDLTITNAISGTGTLSKEALNTLTLTQNNTYAGNNTINAGLLVLQNDAPNPTNKTFNGTGQLRIEPAGTSFTATFSTSGWTFNSTLTGLTLGKTNNVANITIGAAAALNGPITLHGADLTLNAALTTSNTTTGDISLNGTKLLGAGAMNLATGRTLAINVSSSSEYTGAITGSNLTLTKTGAGTLTLNPTSTLVFQTATITTGGLAIAASKQLTVTGTLTNEGTFTLKDGATFVPGTIGTSVAGAGTFNVEKQLTGNATTWDTPNNVGRFWYLGVPMNSVARSSFGTYGSTSNRVWSYNEVSKQYTEVTDGNSLLTGGTGYVHRRNDNNLFTFSATGANGLRGTDLTLSGLTRTSGSSVGFHLIANPYMAYLDWEAVTSSNIEPTYYIRSNGSNNISALISCNSSNDQYVSTAGVLIDEYTDVRYIAPLQSIWVRVGPNSGTGSLSITRSMLSHQANNPGLKNTTVFPTLARVNLLDGPRFDQLLVFMNEYMTNAVDQYDSEKMFVSGAPQIYTMAAGKKLVMNGLNSNKKKISVPLYLELPTSKVYELQLANYNLEDGLILLEDKQEGTIQDFTINDTYAFYANSGVLQNRFVLHFFMPDATITAQGPSNSWAEEESAVNEGGSILVSSNGRGKVAITQDITEFTNDQGSVVVRDAAGRVVYEGQLDGTQTSIRLDTPSGVYFVEVQLNGKLEVKKIFVQQ